MCTESANTLILKIKEYGIGKCSTVEPEFETTDLSQSHASLDFGLIFYFVETQVQQPKIIETCVLCSKIIKKIPKLPCDTFIIDKK